MRIFSSMFLFLVAILLATPALAEEHHPIFSEKEWVLVKTVTDDSRFVDPDGKPVLWLKSEYYRRELPDGQFYKLGMHTVFGETATRVYGVYDKDGERVGKWLQLEKDGKWYTAENGGDVGGEPILDSSGKIIGFTIVLHDKDGNEVARREVKRK